MLRRERVLVGPEQLFAELLATARLQVTSHGTGALSEVSGAAVRYTEPVVENEANTTVAEPPIKRVGDLRLSTIERCSGPSEALRVRKHPDQGHILRSDSGVAVANGLAVLSVIVLASTVTGALILYNAKNAGALRSPWDMARVAFGVAAPSTGIVNWALLIGLTRVITFQSGRVRVRERGLELEARRRPGPC